jgi:hypothetical protein
MADEKFSLKDLAKKYMEKFGAAASKEIEGMRQDPMQRMIRKEMTPTEAAKLSAEQMSTGYKKTTEAPFSALRSAVAEAQAGRAPVPQTLDASKAPAWSDIAQNAGVQNPNALAAVQTVGDLVANDLNIAPGVKGSIAAGRLRPGQLAGEAVQPVGEKVTQHLRTAKDIGLDKLFEKADEVTLKKLMDMGRITPEQAASISIERLRRGYACGGEVKKADGGIIDASGVSGYAEGSEEPVQTTTPQQEAQAQAQQDILAAAEAERLAKMEEAQAQVDQAGMASRSMIAPEVQAGMMSRALDKRQALQDAADPALRQEAQDTLGSISRAAMQGVPTTNTNVDVPQGYGAGVYPVQPGQGTVLAPTPSYVSPEQSAQMAAAEELNAQAAADAKMAVADAENKKRFEKETAVQNRIAAADEKVATEQKADGILAPNSDWLNGLGKAAAIMLGAISQGYTGAKNNAVVDMLEKQVEQEIVKRKYDQEHALALRKAAIDSALLELKKEENKTDSEYKKGLIRNQAAELAMKMGSLQQQQDILARGSKQGGFQASDLPNLDEKTRERLVRKPNGLYVPINRWQDAARITQELSDSADAKNGIKQLLQINEEVGNNPFNKLLKRDMLAKAETIHQGLKGKLRLELFGPGVMTDAEQKIADQIIRNPMDIMTIASANRSSLDTLMRKLDYSERVKLRMAGADVPESENELMLKRFMKHNKGLKESDAITILMNKKNSKGETFWRDE